MLMNIVDKFKNLTREKKIIAAVGAVLVVAAIVIVCIVISNNKYLATTMRLLRVEGTVNIEDSKGGTTKDSEYSEPAGDEGV